MKLKPVVLAVVAAGLVGPAFAAYGHAQHKSAPAGCGMPTSMTAAEATMNGNGVVSGSTSRTCWHNKVKLGGFGDFAYTHAKTAGGSPSKGLDLTAAGLVFDAKINSNWSFKGVADYAWIGDNATGNSLINYETGVVNSNFDDSKTLNMDEALVTYSNSDRTPMYFKAGKGYVNFGSYSNPYAVLPTLTQYMSQLNENYIELGVVSGQGWHASASGWMEDNAISARKHQGAMKVGFDQRHIMSGVGLSGDFSYITNLETVLNKSAYGTGAAATQKNVAGMLAELNADLRGGVKAGATYLRASKNLVVGSSSETSVWGVNLGYGMHAAGYAHAVSASYEGSSEGAWKHRWAVNYDVDLAPNVKGYAQYVKMEKRAATASSAKAWLVGVKGSF